MRRPPQEYNFFIPGEPRGQARTKARAFRRKDGKVVAQVYKSKSQRLEEDKLGWALSQAAPKTLYTGPIGLNLLVLVAVPESWPKRKKLAASIGDIEPMTKPDLSNIVKHVEDVMQGMFFVDDRQITKGNQEKRYCREGEEPGMWISLLCNDAPE
jgi:Holliday junction resolvase RusA-like endonuclease